MNNAKHILITSMNDWNHIVMRPVRDVKSLLRMNNAKHILITSMNDWNHIVMSNDTLTC